MLHYDNNNYTISSVDMSNIQYLLLIIYSFYKKGDTMAKEKAISQETYNLLLNIRDVVAIFAIITIIPILSYRFGRVLIDWQGISKEHEQVTSKLNEKRQEKNRLESILRYYEERQKLQRRLSQAETKYEENNTQEQLEDIQQRLQKEDTTQLSESERIQELSNQIESISDEKRKLEEQSEDLKAQKSLQYFYASLMVGISTLLIGIAIPLFQVGIGFLIGGLITLGYGYWTHWNYMGDLLATISLIIALIGLTLGMWYYRPRMG